MKIIYIPELLALIKKRPGAFLRNNSILELEAYLNGYKFHRFTMEEVPIQDIEDFNYFRNIWIYDRLKIENKEGWINCLFTRAVDDKEAFSLFFDLWEEYTANT
ncbi:MAG: hypothetical protein JEZ12_27250 [Desulfobacterium sp.]|nr:hypothetical protein [Desulfobacterium sp.]